MSLYEVLEKSDRTEYKKLIKDAKEYRYNEIYIINNRNNYEKLKEYNQDYGVYAFISNRGMPLYVGKADVQNLCDRVSQHFGDNDSGGIRYKLKSKKKSLDELNNSTVYIIPMSKCDKDKEISYMEAYLIGTLKPIYNF